MLERCIKKSRTKDVKRGAITYKVAYKYTKEAYLGCAT
jgi:hypothetical protein